MAAGTHRAYAAIATSHNAVSVGNNALSSASAEIDNSTTLELYVDIEVALATQGAARSSGARVPMFLLPSLDGTNFDDLHEQVSEPVGLITYPNTVTAYRRTIRDVPAPGLKFKLAFRNETGQTGTFTVRYRLHSLKSE